MSHNFLLGNSVGELVCVSTLDLIWVVVLDEGGAMLLLLLVGEAPANAGADPSGIPGLPRFLTS